MYKNKYNKLQRAILANKHPDRQLLENEYISNTHIRHYLQTRREANENKPFITQIATHRHDRSGQNTLDLNYTLVE